MTRILRSSAFRIALAFALALTLTTYGVLALVYWRFSVLNISIVGTVLNNEARETLDMAPDKLRRHLDLRLTESLHHLEYVGLYAPDGSEIIGNVPPNFTVPTDGRAHLKRLPPSAEESRGGEAVFVAARRADGGRLVLGRSLIYAKRLERAILNVFVAAIIPVVLIAIAIGAFVSVRASRRLTAIKDAIDRVMRGDLHVRLPARGTASDVDELCRGVNAMLDEIDRLIHQIKSVGDNIAHDLRAPLAVMRARLERGLAGDDATVLRELTHDALGDLQRAMTTVTALLRISELESGVRRRAFGRVDLAEVCRDAFDLYAPLGEANGLSMRLAAGPIVVNGDGDLLREAMANLIENAIKFTPAGGAVEVATGMPTALVRVADTGPGVPPEERDAIFKRFYRAAATSDRPGAGLGLSMASTIVELHGFGLRVADNAPGAIFEITDAALPRATKGGAALILARRAGETDHAQRGGGGSRR